MEIVIQFLFQNYCQRYNGIPQVFVHVTLPVVQSKLSMCDPVTISFSTSL